MLPPVLLTVIGAKQKAHYLLQSCIFVSSIPARMACSEALSHWSVGSSSQKEPPFIQYYLPSTQFRHGCTRYV